MFICYHRYFHCLNGSCCIIWSDIHNSTELGACCSSKYYDYCIALDFDVVFFFNIWYYKIKWQNRSTFFEKVQLTCGHTHLAFMSHCYQPAYQLMNTIIIFHFWNKPLHFLFRFIVFFSSIPFHLNMRNGKLRECLWKKGSAFSIVNWMGPWDILNMARLISIPTRI